MESNKEAEGVVNSYLYDLGLSWEMLKGKKVLDIGADVGFFAEKAKEMGVDVVSIDDHININRRARETNMISRAENLPFGDKSFDLVVAHSTMLAIHYFNGDIKRTIDEARRVLKDGGEFRWGREEPHIYEQRYKVMDGSITFTPIGKTTYPPNLNVGFCTLTK